MRKPKPGNIGWGFNEHTTVRWCTPPNKSNSAYHAVRIVGLMERGTKIICTHTVCGRKLSDVVYLAVDNKTSTVSLNLATDGKYYSQLSITSPLLPICQTCARKLRQA